MKTLKSLSIVSIAAALLIPTLAKADFGEIDIVVQESIENHFKEYRREVDLKTLEYIGEPIALPESKFEINSSVKAQEGFTGGWGWHDCVTKIQLNDDRSITDLGSECYYQID